MYFSRINLGSSAVGSFYLPVCLPVANVRFDIAVGRHFVQDRRVPWRELQLHNMSSVHNLKLFFSLRCVNTETQTKGSNKINTHIIFKVT